MMVARIRRPGVREGYNLWSPAYDDTANPVVALDNRVTIGILDPQAGERVLDAGCGTGRLLGPVIRRGAEAVGIDFSAGMLEVARRKLSGASLVHADLGRPLPLRAGTFDAVLCALVGEHVADLGAFFGHLFEVARPGGRMVFSVYHPEMAAAGIEANFEREGVEYRLGACRHTVEDYRSALAGAGFDEPALREYRGDEALAREVSGGGKYLDFPVLIVMTSRKPTPGGEGTET
jgi:SAM-dependent methyltransferase